MVILLRFLPYVLMLGMSYGLYVLNNKRVLQKAELELALSRNKELVEREARLQEATTKLQASLTLLQAKTSKSLTAVVKLPVQVEEEIVSTVLLEALNDSE